MPEGQSGKGESGKGGGGGKRRREEEEDPLFTPDNPPKKSRSTKDPTQDPALEEEEEEEEEEEDPIVETQPGTSIVVEGPEEEYENLKARRHTVLTQKTGKPKYLEITVIIFYFISRNNKANLSCKNFKLKVQTENCWCPNPLMWPYRSILYPVPCVPIRTPL